MGAFSIADSNFLSRCSRLFEAGQYYAAISFRLDEDHIPLVNPGLFPGLYWNDHLTSVVNGCCHMQIVMQVMLPVNGVPGKRSESQSMLGPFRT